MKKVPHFNWDSIDPLAVHQMIMVKRSLTVTRVMYKCDHKGVISFFFFFSKGSHPSLLVIRVIFLILDIYLMCNFCTKSSMTQTKALKCLRLLQARLPFSDLIAKSRIRSVLIGCTQPTLHWLCSGTKTTCLGPGNKW